MAGADSHHHHRRNHPSTPSTTLPVSVLSGFLGAGKTTLLKHILETKHRTTDDGQPAFRCAVIVNDVAELNIDKDLIDAAASSVVPTDNDVVAMQNGCVCCSIQHEFLEQMIALAQQGTFDYMMIEASGVAEPSQIAQLFAACHEEHDHTQDSAGPEEDHPSHVVLSDVARLDTCVTVVDCHTFLDTFERGHGTGGSRHTKNTTNNTAMLLVEQIEYANVVVLNKTDLVRPAQLEQIQRRVGLFNPTAVVLTSSLTKPLDVTHVMDTHLYSPTDWTLQTVMDRFTHDATIGSTVDGSVAPTPAAMARTVVPPKDCCVASAAAGDTPCCGTKRTKPTSSSTRTSSSDVSTVILPATTGSSRHETRFGIESFVYQSRRPFHPLKFHAEFVEKYFVLVVEEEDDDDVEQDEDTAMEEEKTGQPDDDDDEEERILEQQVEAAAKTTLRHKEMGTLLRSKGFVWLPNMHDIMLTYSQAASMVTLASDHKWNVLRAEAWGTDNDKDGSRMAAKVELRRKFQGPYSDRRQEVVFIGIELKPEKIQKILDDCLLTEEEFNLGIDGWKATFGDTFLDD